MCRKNLPARCSGANFVRDRDGTVKRWDRSGVPGCCWRLDTSGTFAVLDASSRLEKARAGGNSLPVDSELEVDLAVALFLWIVVRNDGREHPEVGCADVGVRIVEPLRNAPKVRDCNLQHERPSSSLESRSMATKQ